MYVFCAADEWCSSIPLLSENRRSSLLVCCRLVWFVIHSFIHLFCKKQLTERNCTIKLENWLKYYNSSNVQLQIKLQVQIGLTVNVNDLLQMLTGKRDNCVQTGLAFLNNILSIKLRSSCWEESLSYHRQWFCFWHWSFVMGGRGHPNPVIWSQGFANISILESFCCLCTYGLVVPWLFS